MEIETPQGKRYLLFNENRKSVWLSPKEKLEGFKTLGSLAELDKLLPRDNKWRVTEKGGLTFHTDAELSKMREETINKKKNSLKRKQEIAERRIKKAVEKATRAGIREGKKLVIKDILSGKNPKITKRISNLMRREQLNSLIQQEAVIKSARKALKQKNSVE
jgi:hypothetical protein